MSLNNIIPASAIVDPRWVDAEEDMEAAEEAADAERIRARARVGVNKVSEFLHERFYRVDRTWPFLYWKLAGRQSSVEMFFPRLGLAVDRFPRPTSMDRQEAAFKATAFKEHGISYVALFPENKLKDLSKYA